MVKKNRVLTTVKQRDETVVNGCFGFYACSPCHDQNSSPSPTRSRYDRPGPSLSLPHSRTSPPAMPGSPSSSAPATHGHGSQVSRPIPSARHYSHSRRRRLLHFLPLDRRFHSPRWRSTSHSRPSPFRRTGPSQGSRQRSCTHSGAAPPSPPPWLHSLLSSSMAPFPS